MRKRNLTVYGDDYDRFCQLCKKHEENNDERVYKQWMFSHILDVYEKSLRGYIKINSNSAISSDEFKKHVQQTINDYHDDTEIKHSKLDDLMINLLISLGYKDGIDLINNTEVWFS